MNKGDTQDSYSSTVNGSNTESHCNASGGSNNCAKNRDEDKRHFPFQLTPSGNLKITQEQVAYDSKRVSVLVSDPINSKVILRPEQGKSCCEEASIMLRAPVLGNIDEQRNYLQDCIECEYECCCCAEDSDPEGQEELLPEMSLARLGVTFFREEKVDWNRMTVPKKSDVVTALYERIKNGQGTDCTIKIDKREFRCHLLLLECYSEFFVENHDQVITLPQEHVTPAAFCLIYSWMLRRMNECYILSRGNILEIITAAQFLKIKELEEQCWAFVDSTENFNEESAFLLYMGAKKYKNNCIMKLMLPRIANFFFILVASQDFVELDVDDVCTFLQSNTIAVYSEMDVFMSALRWLFYNWEERKNCVKQVMSCVRFGLMLPWQLIDLQRNNSNPKFSKVTRNQDVQHMIEEGLAYSITKCRYEDKTDDFVHWIQVFGLREPVPRNFLGGNNAESVYIHYGDFMNDLRKIKMKIIKQQKKRRMKHLEHNGHLHGSYRSLSFPAPAPQPCMFFTPTVMSHTLPPSVSQQGFDKEPECADCLVTHVNIASNLNQ